mgnify:FL=1
MNVITNNKPRALLTWTELPEGIGESEFDYVEDGDRYEPRFFKYRGAWYDAFEFEYISDQPCYAPFRGWGAIQTDSFFSGIVLRFDDEFNFVIVGRYYE